MIRLSPILSSLAAVFAVSVLLAAGRAADDKVSVEKILNPKDFYETSGTRKFTDDEIKQIEALADKSKDETIRVRTEGGCGSGREEPWQG